MQAQRDVRVLRGVGRRGFDADLIEADLLGALAGDVLEVDGVDAKVLERHRIHIVAGGGAVEYVGFEHGVVALAAQRDAVIGEHVHVELHVRADLGVLRVLEQRAQHGQHPVAIELLGRARIAVRQRHVDAAPGLDAEGHAHDLRLHVVEAGGLGVEGKQRRARQALAPGEKLGPLRDRRVLALDRIRSRRCALDYGHCHDRADDRHGRCGLRAVELPQERAHLKARVQRAQRCRVHGAAAERRLIEGEVHIAADRGEPPREGHDVQARAQVLADLAGDVLGVRQQLVKGAVGIEPLGGGLRAHLVDARNVVRAVADQREVVDDLLREHVELRLDAGPVQDGVGHGVDQRDLLVDQLRHVLVAGRDQHRLAGLGRTGRQSADHIVRLNAGDAQQRQAHAGDRLQERFGLGAQIIGHRRAVRLVLGEQIVAEGLARRVKHDRDLRAREIAQQAY